MLSNLRLQRLLASDAERLLPLDQARRGSRGARVAIVEDNPSRGAPKLGQLALEGDLSGSGDRRSMKPGVARKGEDHFARTQRDQPAIGERCAQTRGALPNRLHRPVPAFGRRKLRLLFARLDGGAGAGCGGGATGGAGGLGGEREASGAKVRGFGATSRRSDAADFAVWGRGKLFHLTNEVRNRRDRRKLHGFEQGHLEKKAWLIGSSDFTQALVNRVEESSQLGGIGFIAERAQCLLL